jgi:hypothetical protein
MELATQPLSDKTNTVIIVPVMDNCIKYMLLVNPLDSRLQPELVGVWNSERPQLVEDVPYRDLGEMNVFARRWRGEHRGKWLTVPKLSGFCLLMTRAVYQAVGGLDTAFGLGFFDDDDLALRARRAGFELAVARDLFVHHFGSRTFAGNGVDAEKLLDENAVKFAAKWGLTAPLGKRVALRPFSAHPKTNANGNGKGQSTAAELDAHDRAGLKCDEPSETFIPLTSHYPIPLRHFIGVAPRTGNHLP